MIHQSRRSIDPLERAINEGRVVSESDGIRVKAESAKLARQFTTKDCEPSISEIIVLRLSRMEFCAGVGWLTSEAYLAWEDAQTQCCRFLMIELTCWEFRLSFDSR